MAKAARVAAKGYTFSREWGHSFHLCNLRYLLGATWRERAARPLRALEVGLLC
jgi:hypothetical protein